MAFRLVLLFVVLAPVSIAQDLTRIISSPQSVNVSIGDNAVFNCTAIASFINWEINGGPIDSDLIGKGYDQGPLITLNVSQNLRTDSLTVLGSADNNNASIACVAILRAQIYPAFEFVGNSSDPALLLVQGLLESVNNLIVVPINSTTVLISWSPPFTLEGVPILGYNVTIANTTSGENETMSVEGNTTMLYYSIDHPDPDNNFTVIVVPINEAGPGDVTEMFSFSFAVLSSTVSMSQSFTQSSSVCIQTTTVSVHVSPSMEPNKPTDATLDTSENLYEKLVDETGPSDEPPNASLYAELADFNIKRARATPQLDEVHTTKSLERTNGNVEDQKRQANIHGVPSMKDIAQISQQVPHKWRLIGMQLKVDPAELDQIASDCGSDASQCCSKLFSKWAAGEVTASCSFTWRGVIETLDNDLVRESSLARSLESTYI